MARDGICAIATAPGEGGIAIVRMSGAGAREILSACFRPARAREILSHRMMYGHAVDARGVALDEVMAVFFAAPNTYTREDMFEIQCHGGGICARRVLERVIALGARIAEPGEFTRRAFLNGRIDLSRAEAVMALIGAKSEAAARASLRQLEGEDDPHIWLDPARATQMAENLCAGLTALYPQYEQTFRANTDQLKERLAELEAYGREALSGLRCRQLITFHDGFGYLAEAFDLEILAAVEEEAGSEASAADLTEIITLVRENQLPAVFVEANGSDGAASVIRAETGVSVGTLDTAMGGSDYFEAMKANFDTLKEALQ